MRVMPHDEAIAFLAHGTRTGKIAMTRADGSPVVTPVWFAVEGDDLVFTTWSDSGKAKRIRRDPRVALIVDLEEPPYAYVLVEGVATLSGDLDEVRRIATEVGGRYMGADRAEEYGERNGVEGELAVRITVKRMTAHDEISS